ncbi:MAG: acetyl-CoA C-acyltransferase [Actinobacteria bacterium]|nr:MAG: acetyl-CoA C-acyltransferase [Actinomycetota bacterium]
MRTCTSSRTAATIRRSSCRRCSIACCTSGSRRPPPVRCRSAPPPRKAARSGVLAVGAPPLRGALGLRSLLGGDLGAHLVLAELRAPGLPPALVLSLDHLIHVLELEADLVLVAASGLPVQLLGARTRIPLADREEDPEDHQPDDHDSHTEQGVVHARSVRAAWRPATTGYDRVVPELRDAVIVDALRTPIGRYAGVLSTVRTDDLATRVVEEAVERNDLPTDAIDDVVFGCTNAAGEDNRNVARMASLLAGLPVEVPGVTVNRLCASGLEAVRQAAHAIQANEGELLLAGGVESMSRSPFVMLKPERGFPRGTMELVDTTIGWRFVNPRMEERYSTESMGETAENVAERYGVSREDQDAFALESHRRAVAATEAGRFDEEIVTVDAPQPKGPPVTIHSDEGPRPDTSLEKLAKLRPVFREGGTVTAGNSSQINDGAACLVVTTEEGARQLGREPLARVVSTGAAGVDPAYMGVGPVPASRKALERAGLSVDDLDLVELNEAFAAQVLASMRELGIPHEKLNVNGGAIALGHPLGQSGARLLGTLIWELRRRGGRFGLATMCIGVGQGLAMIVENPAA